MNILGIFRGFPGLGRVVSGVSLLETLRDKYACKVKIISYLQGNRYLESRGYTNIQEAIPMDYSSIGLLPTNRMGVYIHSTIKSFSPDIVLIDGEPLIIQALRISYPNLKIVALLNPADVDNPHNDKEAMDYFNYLYSLTDLAIVHGLRKPNLVNSYKRQISLGTIIRNEILKIDYKPSNDIYCILGGGTVNVGYQFESSTIAIANISKQLAKLLKSYNMHIICSSQNIYDALSESQNEDNVILYNDVLQAEEYYSKAALVITRSGRNTLSELAYLGIPALSFVTGDNYRRVEQEQNLANINAANISAISLDSSTDEIATIAKDKINQGSTNNGFIIGNKIAIQEILTL